MGDPLNLFQKKKSPNLSTSFNNIKKDIHLLNDWVQFLVKQNEEQARTINNLKEKLQSQSPHKEELESIHRRLSQLESSKPVRKQFHERIVRKIKRNSKQYIKNMILSLIRKHGKMSALSLREIVVEEKALCSKSTLYRLLEEIESSEDLAVIQEGKEKLYLYS